MEVYKIPDILKKRLLKSIHLSYKRWSRDTWINTIESLQQKCQHFYSKTDSAQKKGSH